MPLVVFATSRYHMMRFGNALPNSFESDRKTEQIWRSQPIVGIARFGPVTGKSPTNETLNFRTSFAPSIRCTRSARDTTLELEEMTTAEWTALAALALYATTALAVVLYQAVRSPVGCESWLLYVVNRLYLGLCFHWRANRNCPWGTADGALIVANHRGPVDPQIVWMNHHVHPGERKLRHHRFLTAREYVELPGLVGWICRVMRSIPLGRDGKDMAAVQTALRLLRQGELVAIFPEGRINPFDELLKGDAGVAWLALKAKVPVYPIYLHNAPEYGASMIEPFWTFRRVRVTYGDPIDLSQFSWRKPTPEQLQEVTDHIMRKLAELGNTTYSGLTLEELQQQKDDAAG